MEIPTSPTNYSPPPGPPDCDPPSPWEAECEIIAVLNAIRTVSDIHDNEMELLAGRWNYIHRKESMYYYTPHAQGIIGFIRPEEDLMLPEGP